MNINAHFLRGSRWKSDRWRTLSRFPLGFLGGGSGSGFGFANQLVKSRGLVGGMGHAKPNVLQKYYSVRRCNKLDVLHHWNILTWPSYPAVSASANTCIAILPRPTGPTSVVQSGRPRNWHRATIAAGPLWGDASESIFINPSDAWHALHLLDTKGELGVSGWKARLICLRTTESKSSWLTWKGKGSGSEESFWRKGMRKLGQVQYEHVRVESCPDWWGRAERWNPEFLY